MKTAYRPGLKGILAGDLAGYLIGKRVEVVRQSSRTGGLTVKMLEVAGLHEPGSTLNINPYNFKVTS